jgi:D-alanyl-lipoteichoic acid acyltransferase DltB (MBOAT superfamily)
MIKQNEIPLYILLAYSIIYSIIGNPENVWWSGSYFIVNYFTMLLLFSGHKNKVIRIVGMALSISILIFIILKYFFGLSVDRAYSIVPLLISILGIYTLEKKNN